MVSPMPDPPVSPTPPWGAPTRTLTPWAPSGTLPHRPPSPRCSPPFQPHAVTRTWSPQCHPQLPTARAPCQHLEVGHVLHSDSPWLQPPARGPDRRGGAGCKPSLVPTRHRGDPGEPPGTGGGLCQGWDALGMPWGQGVPQETNPWDTLEQEHQRDTLGSVRGPQVHLWSLTGVTTATTGCHGATVVTAG